VSLRDFSPFPQNPHLIEKTEQNQYTDPVSNPLEVKSQFNPAGDQPAAIAKLSEGLKKGYKHQTLLGVTGSGKTATMAWTIENSQKPALIISHNKTLAAQLAEEFADFFPNNAVEYFVSYYDYYQPEAYIARTDTYIQKDASINEEIDRLRHATMESILTRPDVIVVASVSCIYGIGAPEDFLGSRLEVTPGQKISRQELLKHLTSLQYKRNDTDLARGSFRVRGDTVDIHPAGEDNILRLDFFGPVIESLARLDALTGEVLEKPTIGLVFPATFFMTTESKKKAAMTTIRAELSERIKQLKKIGKDLEAQRLAQRTTYDLEMIEQIGYVSGIENYSRHVDDRQPGQPPTTLIDYFKYRYGPEGFLTFIDESHMTIPQISAMYGGDAARKKSLIEHGFRLPSAADNRPLKFHEFEDRVNQTIFVSATPAQYELNKSQHIVQQIVRPTGLLDPTIEIVPTTNQIDDVIDRIQDRIKLEQRVLVTTLTKRMAEELSTYLVELGIKSAYIHSDVDNLERLEILRDLRQGRYDVLVGINLLREGLDLPEVSLVAIMDADKEGYLRSQTSLIQTMGRAARHAQGHVVMYADRETGSMQRAIEETNRRREVQDAYNKKHGLTPQGIIKAIRSSKFGPSQKTIKESLPDISRLSKIELDRVLKDLSNKMNLAAQNLEFEKAIDLRDVITALRKKARKSQK